MDYKFKVQSSKFKVQSSKFKVKSRKSKVSLLTTHYSLLLFFLFYFPFVSAQRLEVHAIKDFSTDENAKKTWGVGAAVDFDQWVKNTTFRVGFDWAIFNDKLSSNHNKFQRMSGSIAAFYSFNINTKLSFQCGAEINYTHFTHSFLYGREYQGDTLTWKETTLVQKGDFIGIGPFIGFQYKLSERFNVTLSVVPTCLIPVNQKSSMIDVEPEYLKGVWLFPVRLGLSYKLFQYQ